MEVPRSEYPESTDKNRLLTAAEMFTAVLRSTRTARDIPEATEPQQQDESNEQ